jgi:DNA repair protein RadD
MLIKDVWFQDEAVDATFAAFGRPDTHPVIAMPTGTGKSVVIAKTIRRLMLNWPTQRPLMLTHDARLIEQNCQRLRDLWPAAPVGIYSADLGMRDAHMPIVMGGVKSVLNAIDLIGRRTIVLVDEAHMLSPEEDSMYQQVYRSLLVKNPHVIFVGYSATIFRMKMGLITSEGGLFNHVAYDLTGVENFNRLIAEGYLAPLVPRPTSVSLDLSDVGISKGEFKPGELEKAEAAVLEKALNEVCYFGQDRRAWMVFTAGIKNAETAAAILNGWGIPSAAVHSKKKDNDKIIEAYKRGELRCIVNNNMLTTGFDHRPVDLIGMLRATMSPGLWVQMLGRGTRVSPETGKTNCLVLDFANNAPRLGPINDPRIPRKKGEATGEVPIKICPKCGVYNHASYRYCGRVPYPSAEGCGFEFPAKEKIEASAGFVPLIRDDKFIVERFKVDGVFYSQHEKEGSPPMLKVIYACGLRSFSELVMLEHSGYPNDLAQNWWKQRHNETAPLTVRTALERKRELREPQFIRVHTNANFPKILSHEF